MFGERLPTDSGYASPMAVKRRHLEQLLQTKFGFVEAPNRSDDHRCYQLVLAGLAPIHTKVSHNVKDIGPKLQGIIARQLLVRGPFFEEMLGCTKGRAEYYRQVQTDPFMAY